MINMDLLFPAKAHPVLAELGKVDWLDLDCDPDNLNVTTLKVRWSEVAKIPKARQQEARWLINAVSNTGHGAWSMLEAVGRCITNSPKVFEPSDEQYDSMRQVEIHLQIADYLQPYEAMVVRLPKEGRRRLAEETGVMLKHAPQLALLHTRLAATGRRYIIISHRFGETYLGGHENVHVMQQRVQDDRPIEWFLHKWVPPEDTDWTPRIADVVPDEAAQRFASLSGRACLNLMLMLTHFGHQDGPPLDPVAYAKHRSKPALAHRALADFSTVLLTQDIVVRKVEGPRPQPGEPTGREMPTHWRRGHWRQQHHGTGRAQTKLVFIRPVLVRADRGLDHTPTSAIYHN